MSSTRSCQPIEIRNPVLGVRRVTVVRNWERKSLHELYLRGSVNVQLLEWRRDDELLALDPRAQKLEGEVLALAGNREGLLAARWVECGQCPEVGSASCQR